MGSNLALCLSPAERHRDRLVSLSFVGNQESL